MLRNKEGNREGLEIRLLPNLMSSLFFVFCLVGSAGCGSESPFDKKPDTGTDTSTSIGTATGGVVGSGGSPVAGSPAVGDQAGLPGLDIPPYDGTGAVGSPITVGVGLLSPVPVYVKEAKEYGCERLPTPPLNQIKTGCLSVCGWVMPAKICQVPSPNLDKKLNADGFEIRPEPKVEPKLQPAIEMFKAYAKSAGITIKQKALDDLIVVQFFPAPKDNTFTAGDGSFNMSRVISGMCRYITGVDSNGAVSNWTQVEIIDNIGKMDNPYSLTTLFHELGHCLFRVSHPSKHSPLRVEIMDGFGSSTISNSEWEESLREFFSLDYLRTLPKNSFTHLSELPPKPIVFNKD